MIHHFLLNQNFSTIPHLVKVKVCISVTKNYFSNFSTTSIKFFKLILLTYLATYLLHLAGCSRTLAVNHSCLITYIAKKV